MPVHPAQAKLLATWKLSSREATYGRRPNSQDLIVPTRDETARRPNEGQEALQHDLNLPGLRTRADAKRKRRGHDLRRRFITLAQVDGADHFELEAVMHVRAAIIDHSLTSFPWPALCAEVSKAAHRDPRVDRRRPCYVACYTPARAYVAHST